ncbi:hypothetical protein PILCRDRAFT_269933 [Piloderma croceum F 1598]|uniref:Uncharacterized protein n=1 Tax=Piloderma croceum (strain F 1598) TaxID=765440 RepID=A0A0C3CEC1_PILCF|nr:hypothetical protein PILCRDRAFT_269933 [Piloderma croceum F 1598]
MVQVHQAPRSNCLSGYFLISTISHKRPRRQPNGYDVSRSEDDHRRTAKDSFHSHAAVVELPTVYRAGLRITLHRQKHTEHPIAFQRKPINDTIAPDTKFSRK